MLNYFEALNRAFVTMDDRAVRALVTPECKCLDTIDAIPEEKALGNRIKLVYKTIGAVAHDATATNVGVTYSYNIDQNSVVDANGKLVEKFPSVRNGLKELEVVRRADQWLISRVVTYVDKK